MSVAYIEKIIYFLHKQAILMRRLSVLSISFQLVFPGVALCKMTHMLVLSVVMLTLIRVECWNKVYYLVIVLSAAIMPFILNVVMLSVVILSVIFQ